MSEIPLYNKEGQLGPTHDILIVCNPVRTDKLKWIEINGAEAHIKYTVDNNTTIHAPITGRVTRIEPNDDGFGYIVELSSETSICILTGFDMLLVNLGEHVNAGNRIGSLRGIKDGQEKDILFHIATRYDGVALNQILKIK